MFKLSYSGTMEIHESVNISDITLPLVTICQANTYNLTALNNNAEPFGSALFGFVVSINLPLKSDLARSPVREGAQHVTEIHDATAIDILVWINVSP